MHYITFNIWLVVTVGSFLVPQGLVSAGKKCLAQLDVVEPHPRMTREEKLKTIIFCACEALLDPGAALSRKEKEAGGRREKLNYYTNKSAVPDDDDLAVVQIKDEVRSALLPSSLSPREWLSGWNGDGRRAARACDAMAEMIKIVSRKEFSLLLKSSLELFKEHLASVIRSFLPT